MKSLIFGWVSLVITIIWFTINIISEIRREYLYTNEFESYWELADKSSTIEEKSRYINLFVESLEKSGLQGEYNAVFYKTPTVSFDKNLLALKSLQQRLEEIKTMDIRSFEYQTAIQQITGQEQGEASEMLSVLHGCWTKNNYFFYWTWVGGINWCLWTCLLIAMVVSFFIYADNKF